MGELEVQRAMGWVLRETRSLHEERDTWKPLLLVLPFHILNEDRTELVKVCLVLLESLWIQLRGPGLLCTGPCSKADGFTIALAAWRAARAGLQNSCPGAAS